MMHCNECGDLIPVRCYCHTCYVQLDAENARLREALQQIADATLETWTSYCNVDGHHELVIKTMGDMPAIASAALGKE
jgi:NifB/MoaA-like Fe-S oxidoreductase